MSVSGIVELTNNELRDLINKGEVCQGALCIRRVPAVDDSTSDVRLRE